MQITIETGDYTKENHYEVYLHWFEEGTGYFGNIYIDSTNDIIKIDSEATGKDFVKEILSKMVDQAKLIG